MLQSRLAPTYQIIVQVSSMDRMIRNLRRRANPAPWRRILVFVLFAALGISALWVLSAL